MNGSKVSMVISCYNKAEYIGEMLDSDVVGASYFEIETLIDEFCNRSFEIAAGRSGAS
jgi:hypothetical protein